MDKKYCPACYARIRSEVLFCTCCGERQCEDISLGPKVTVLATDEKSTSYSLNNGRSTIGRHIKNTIIVNDEHASSYHAAIIVDNEDIIIEDLDSRNGVYVNGKKIKKNAKLKRGSLIKIGSTILKFIPENEYVEEVR